MGKQADRNVLKFEYRADSDPTLQESTKIGGIKKPTFFSVQEALYQYLTLKDTQRPRRRASLQAFPNRVWERECVTSVR